MSSLIYLFVIIWIHYINAYVVDFNDLLFNSTGINITRVGIKIIAGGLVTIDIEEKIILGAIEPGRRIECVLSAIIASNWPHIFQFCDVESEFATIEYDDSLTEYSIYVKNPMNQALHIDSIKIETTDARKIGWIEHYCNITQSYPLSSVENYTCSSGATSSGSISIKNSSILIPLRDVKGIEAHTVIYDFEDIRSNCTQCDSAQKSIDTEFILVINEARTYDDAQRFCESIGSNLVTVITLDQLRMITELNKVYNLVKTWIGLRDENNDGEYIWADGTECNSSCNDLSYWSKGEPNNILTLGEETCVQFQTYIYGQQEGIGTFNDVQCNSKLPFYCNAVSDVLIFQMDGNTTSTPINIPQTVEDHVQLTKWQVVSISIGIGILFVIIVIIGCCVHHRKIKVIHIQHSESMTTLQAEYDEKLKDKSHTIPTETSSEDMPFDHQKSEDHRISMITSSEDSKDAQLSRIIIDIDNGDSMQNLEGDPLVEPSI